MIEFENSDLRDLQEVNGYVFQDVHGERIAIGKGFDYENVFDFVNAYFEEYGSEDFAKKLGYVDAVDMLRSWFSGVPVDENDLLDWCNESFSGIDADSLQDDYDYEREDRLEAEDEMYDRAAGK